MPNPNAIVSNHIRLDPPLDRPSAELRAAEGFSVVLDDGRQVQLDPADQKSAGLARVLDGLEKLRRPVYLELDPVTSHIRRLLIPHLTRVAALRSVKDGIEVDLELSHARHLLLRDEPEFAEIEGRLGAALKGKGVVIVTEDDAHNIIDVRDYEPGPDDGPLPPFPKPDHPLERGWLGDLLDWIWRWPFWPWWWLRGCISMARAQQVFNAMSATSCAPLTVPVPCIPFMYPDDGCWGRAHEMCRLMIAMGLSPRKVWIQGSLKAATKNNPNCFVYWGWHVAPTLCVRRSFFRTEQMVIDPSLFTMPVTQATWKSVQGDPNATLTPSTADIFYLWGNVTDPTYAQTNQVLATYRLQLMNRSVQIGPPPYANCP